MSTKKDEETKKFQELISNINLLKNKRYGCPWQKLQTHETLIPYLMEESHELINAIKNKDPENMKEELGDILFQIMLHAELGSEKKLFSIKDILHTLNNKIKSRHPYIFKNRQKTSIEEAQKIWNSIKIKNKSDNNSDKKNIFSNLNASLEYLNPIQETEQINHQLKKYGFRWNYNEEILNQVIEEIKELKESINGGNKKEIEEKFGGILFNLISLSSFLKINTYTSLRYTNAKFKTRFSSLEKLLNDRITSQSDEAFRKLWNITKATFTKTSQKSNEQ
tara:strand:+ start:115 stop:951 length:837 start_codon:yes stop_codon:yes gene_type:complete